MAYTEEEAKYKAAYREWLSRAVVMTLAGRAPPLPPEPPKKASPKEAGQ